MLKRATKEAAGVYVTRVELSIGSLDLFRFVDHDHAFPRHSHERFTVGVFGNRNGSIRFRRGTWRATDGAILAVPPDEAHSADPLRGSGWTYRTLYPSTRIVDLALDVSASSSAPVFDRPVIHDPSLARSLFDLHSALESSPPSLAMEETLLELLRRLVYSHGCERILLTGDTSPAAVALARTYLEDNFGKSVKLAELSAICGISPFHLIRSFRDHVGMPPHAYLTQVRANRARQMLTSGEGLSSAAYLCGFSDQSHLTRTFKRIFGITPGAYASRAAQRSSTLPPLSK
jgi:AraC-like DNA-binding protein